MSTRTISPTARQRLVEHVDYADAAGRVERLVGKGQRAGIAPEVGEVRLAPALAGRGDHRLGGVDAHCQALAGDRRQPPGVVPRPAADIEHTIARGYAEHVHGDAALLCRPRAPQPE